MHMSTTGLKKDMHMSTMGLKKDMHKSTTGLKKDIHMSTTGLRKDMHIKWKKEYILYYSSMQFLSDFKCKFLAFQTKLSIYLFCKAFEMNI